MTPAGRETTTRTRRRTPPRACCRACRPRASPPGSAPTATRSDPTSPCCSRSRRKRRRRRRAPSTACSRPTPGPTRLAPRLGRLLDRSNDGLSRLRISARRGELDRLARQAKPLRRLAARAADVHRRPGTAGVKKVFGVTLGILTAMGGFVDIGDIVANSDDRRALRHVAGVGGAARRRRHHRVRRDGGPGGAASPSAPRSTSCASGSARAPGW